MLLVILITGQLIGMHAIANTEEETHLELITGPYEPLLSPSIKHNGPIAYIIKEAFRLEGVQVSFKFRPWKRALTSLKKGNAHGAAFLRNNKERAKYLFFSDPIMDMSTVLFYLKDKPFEWNNMNDLKRFKIGVLRGVSHGTSFDEAVGSNLITVDSVKDYPTAFRMLFLGRVDLVAAAYTPGINQMLKQRLTDSQQRQISRHRKPIDQHYMTIALTKSYDKDKKMLKRFNRGLSKVKKRMGEYFLLNPCNASTTEAISLTKDEIKFYDSACKNYDKVIWH